MGFEIFTYCILLFHWFKIQQFIIIKMEKPLRVNYTKFIFLLLVLLGLLPRPLKCRTMAASRDKMNFLLCDDHDKLVSGINLGISNSFPLWNISLFTANIGKIKRNPVLVRNSIYRESKNICIYVCSQCLIIYIQPRFAIIE